MQVNLCYKTYPFKMSLQAMRDFKRATGKDLWYTLVNLLEVYFSNLDKPVLTLLKALYETVDFETASHAIHCLIKAEDKSIELEQIQDAMFRVGWRPIEDDDSEYRQPYPIVLVQMSKAVDEQLSDEVNVKKK